MVIVRHHGTAMYYVKSDLEGVFEPWQLFARGRWHIVFIRLHDISTRAPDLPEVLVSFQHSTFQVFKAAFCC